MKFIIEVELSPKAVAQAQREKVTPEQIAEAFTEAVSETFSDDDMFVADSVTARYVPRSEQS